MAQWSTRVSKDAAAFLYLERVFVLSLARVGFRVAIANGSLVGCREEEAWSPGWRGWRLWLIAWKDCSSTFQSKWVLEKTSSLVTLVSWCFQLVVKAFSYGSAFCYYVKSLVAGSFAVCARCCTLRVVSPFIPQL
eukprot:Gb_26608 [translate_table: standard]